MRISRVVSVGAVVSLVACISVAQETNVLPQDPPPDSLTSQTPTLAETQTESSSDTSLQGDHEGAPSGWTARMASGGVLRRLPMRGVSNYLPLLPGVVKLGSRLHIRGSRDYESAYYLDDIPVTDLWNRSNAVPLLPEAIESMTLHSGAYGAEFGSAGGGVVIQKMRLPRDSLIFSLDYQTDNLAQSGSQFLGTSSFGFENIVGTFGMPLPLGFRVFVAAQYNRLENRQTLWLEPFRYDTVDVFYFHPVGADTAIGPVDFKRNSLPNNWIETHTVQGQLHWQWSSYQVRFIGSASREVMPIGTSWPLTVINYLRQWRDIKSTSHSSFGALEFRHEVGKDLSYRIIASFLQQTNEQVDPDFGNSWQLYPDSLANARLYYSKYQRDRVIGPLYEPYMWRYLRTFDMQFETGYGLRFNHGWAPNNQYSKWQQGNTRIAADLVLHATDGWDIKAGGSFEQWKRRSYVVGDINGYLATLDTYPWDGIPDKTFASEREKELILRENGRIDNYGYDYVGEEIEEGADAPKEPRFASFYVTNRVKDGDLTIHVGGRYEVFDPRSQGVSGYDAPREELIDTTLPPYYTSVLKDSVLTTQEQTSLVLPRLSFSFDPSHHLSVFGAYGRYAQYAPLMYLTQSLASLTSTVAPVYWSSGIVGFLAEPERTTHYEVGVRTMFDGGWNLDVVLFRKDFVNQLQIDYVTDASGNGLFEAYLNHGTGNSRGFEVSLSMIHRSWLNVGLRYSFTSTNAKRTDLSDDPNPYSYTDPANLTTISEAMQRVDYEIQHCGSAVVALTSGEQNGPLFGGWELTGVLTFQSGQPYTKVDQIQLITGGWSMWGAVYAQMFSPTYAVPLEKRNSSSTPWVLNADLRISKALRVANINAILYVNILNLFDTKQVLGVYPTTGNAVEDGWFNGYQAKVYKDYYPQFGGLYEDINLKNRRGYMAYEGDDPFGPPRQIRVGIGLVY